MLQKVKIQVSQNCLSHFLSEPIQYIHLSTPKTVGAHVQRRFLFQFIFICTKFKRNKHPLQTTVGVPKLLTINTK